jgi:hypothetical protein
MSPGGLLSTGTGVSDGTADCAGVDDGEATDEEVGLTAGVVEGVEAVPADAPPHAARRMAAATAPTVHVVLRLTDRSLPLGDVPVVRRSL